MSASSAEGLTVATCSWTFSNLLLPQGKNLCTELKKLMLEFIYNDEVLRRNQELHRFARSGLSFKHETRSGFVWRRGRFEDLGNYCYSVLYLLLHYYFEWWAPGFSPFGPLMEQWPSLRPETPSTPATCVMRGDVLEFIMEFMRETGPSVSSEIRDQRLKLNATMRSLGDVVDSCNRLIFSSQRGGPPVVSQCPDACLYSMKLLHAVVLHTEDVPREIGVAYLSEPPWQPSVSSSSRSSSSTVGHNRGSQPP